MGPQEDLVVLRKFAPETSDFGLRLCVALAWIVRDKTPSNQMFNRCNLVLCEARDELYARGVL